MDDCLSGGAIEAMCRGDSVESPVLQVELTFQECEVNDDAFPSGFDEVDDDRNAVILSDGQHSCKALLSTKLARMLSTGELDETDVIKVKSYCSLHRGLIIIRDLDVVKKGSDIGVMLGEPTCLSAPSQITGPSQGAEPSRCTGSLQGPGPSLGLGPAQGTRSSQGSRTSQSAGPSQSPGPSKSTGKCQRPGPSQGVKPSPSPGPSKSTGLSLGSRPSESPGPSQGVKPSPSPGPSKSTGLSLGSRPSESPGPSQGVKPSPSPGPSKSTGLSLGSRPSESPGPSQGVKPSPSPGPSKSTGLSLGSRPSESAGPSQGAGQSLDTRQSQSAGQSQSSRPSEGPGPSQESSCPRTPMAHEKEQRHPQGLICPLCLEVFKKPTLLRCGHTFCKVCLQSYDAEHRAQDYMECPVCRKRTKLHREHRVAGLSPNFSVKGLRHELLGNGDCSSLRFCPVHRQVYMDILCEDCDNFICLNCLFDNHQGHKIKKKEELEGDLKKKRDVLIQRSEAKKTQLRKSITTAEQYYTNVQSHFKSLDKEITDSFAKKLRILSENEEKLRMKMDDARKKSHELFQSLIAGQRESVASINSLLTQITGKTFKYLDSQTLKSHRAQYSNLENILMKDIDEETMVGAKQTAERTRLCHADEKVLDLGHVELGRKATASNDQVVMTGIGGSAQKPQASGKVLTSSASGSAQEPWARCKVVMSIAGGSVEEPQARCKVADTPSVSSNNFLKIVRVIDTGDHISGMAVVSQDAVAIGYGRHRKGSDIFYVSGVKMPHLKSEVGNVYDLAFLSDDRAAVSLGMSKCCLYTQERKKDVAYLFKIGGTCLRLCGDQHDRVYAVNGNPEIYVFHGSDPDPQRRIPVRHPQPRQICVTKSGLLITSTSTSAVVRSTVTVYDENGHFLSSIKGCSASSERLYVAVDDQDRILIARVIDDCELLKVTRFSLTCNGTTLVEQKKFKDYVLPCKIAMKCDPCYMVSLTPNMLAFASGTRLYFIDLNG